MYACVFCAFIDAEKVKLLSYLMHSFSNSTNFRSGNDGLLRIIAGTSSGAGDSSQTAGTVVPLNPEHSCQSAVHGSRQIV
jgi:hypothetical protein